MHTLQIFDVPYLELFIDALVAERGCALNTKHAYTSDLLLFFQCIGKHPLHVTDTDVLDYIEAQACHTPATLARKISALKQFYQFLISEELLDKNPLQFVTLPKKIKKLPIYLSENEVERLMDALHSTDPETIRLRAMLALLYGSGLRVSEMLTLRFSEFQTLLARPTPHPFIVINGKGGRERIVPLSHVTLQTIATYLPSRNYFLGKIHHPMVHRKAQHFLFPSRGKEGTLTRQRVDQLIKDLATAANIDRSKLSPHVLRHAFATHLLQNGADLLSIQKFLGHEDIGTTEIYTHVLPNHVERLVTTHHPLAKKPSASCS